MKQKQKSNRNELKEHHGVITWIEWGKNNTCVYTHTHTPSVAFRHLPPNSARFGYATEGALFYLRTAVHRVGGQRRWTAARK